MTPEAWRRVGELFHQALEIPSESRTRWVADHCQDEELRREIASLLESDRAAAQGFVHKQVKAGVVALYEEDNPASALRRIGPYELLQELGRGGMGTVYLARRDDQQYDLNVAIKLVNPGMDTSFMLQRFRRERQILANLQHPHIARLLEGGTTGDGLPYIVMEYIEGSWITEYCRIHDLAIEQRLRLFLDVCSAVEYAHRNFVVHRDIKPGNILVDKHGVPKLLDFGICKLLYADALMTGNTIAEGGRMLTPDYASPEQIRGDPVTIASDVYSLAAVLYELLTQTKAHRFENYTLHEIERVICTEEAIRPSSAVPDRAAARRLSGDLDNILLRALQKDPQRRYATVDQFSEDIRRHLSYLPVKARPDTVQYRIGKFVRRRTGTAIASAIALSALLAGVAVSSYQAHLANRRSEQVRELANSIIFNISDSIQDVPGTTVARAALVKAALPYLDSVAGSSGSDPGLLWELSRAYQKIGDLQGQPARANLGRPIDALVSYRKAIQILERIYRGKPVAAQVIESLIEIHQSAGLVETHMGATVNALRDYQEALRLAKEHLAAKPRDEERQRLMASSCNRMGDAQLLFRDPQAALRTFQTGLDAFHSTEPRGVNARRSLSVVYMRIGEALEETGPVPKAVENLRRGVEIREQLFERNPASLEARRDLFVAYTNLGNVLGGARSINMGDTEAAAEAFRKALEIAQDLAKQDPRNARARSDLAFAYSKIGEVTRVRDPRAAAEWFRRSLAITRELLELDPPAKSAETRRWDAERRDGLADALYRSGDPAAALVQSKRAQQTWRELANAEPIRVDLQQEVLSSYCRVCDLESSLGEVDQARENRQQALQMMERVTGNRSSLYVLRDLANCYEAFGRLDVHLAAAQTLSRNAGRERWREAHSWYRKSLDVWTEWQSRGAGDPPSLERLNAVKDQLAAVNKRL